MTNNEILRASLLDILFDNRNKDYGAYVLRRNYNHRLFIALASALSIVFFILLLNSFHKKKPEQVLQTFKNNEVIIRPYTIEPEKPKEPEKLKEEIKPAQKIAQVKYQTMKIVPDKIAIKNLPTIDDIRKKIISNQEVKGKTIEGKSKEIIEPNTNSGNGGGADQTKSEGTFIPVERSPEFPGGQAALILFLKNNLNTPEELQVGEKKSVQVRFKVDIDGTISSVEVVQSGGTLFDREVIRVCKRMPRWKPAFQNGMNIPVSYVLPVTFLGVEQ